MGTAETSRFPSALQAVGHGATGAGGDPELPSCSMVFFRHIPKTGGTTFTIWMTSMRSLHGFGVLSFFDPMDAPSLPSLAEWSATRSNNSSARSLIHRWAADLETLPPGAPVPSERAWRVMREYHGQDQADWAAWTHERPTYLRIAQAHGCYTPTVTLVREPCAFFVSHITYSLGRFYVERRSPNATKGLNPNSRLEQHASLSVEQYVEALGNFQSNYVMGASYHSPHQPRNRQHLVEWVQRNIDVLGTTERIDDTVRATCQAAGIPARLCRSRLDHALHSDMLCVRGLMRALQVPSTHVLAPQAPAKSVDEVRHLCRDPRELYTRIIKSDAMAEAVRMHAPYDLELYRLADEAIRLWRANAPSDWLAPSLGGDTLEDK
eukprot:scaffold64411_cov32-Tisochrysis_lutea.AAC.1